MKHIVAILVFLTTLPLTATDLYRQLSKTDAVVQEPLHARFRTSYEVLPISDTDEIGLVGTHFDFHPFRSFDPFYTGFGFYSAATGEEGGFFTFGYTLGLDYEFYNFHTDAGVYLGGGGGSHLSFPGGGMIVRTHAALSYEVKGVELVVGVARTDFPNTTNVEYKSDTPLRWYQLH